MKSFEMEVNSPRSRVHKAFVAGLVGLACFASGAAMAGKPEASTSVLKVDAPMLEATAVLIDLDSGTSCTPNSPQGNLCPDTELTMWFHDSLGIVAYGNPLNYSVDITVGTLRGIRFDEVDSRLVSMVPVKFTRSAVSHLGFTDTLLVDAGGVLYKVGFFECHRHDDNFNIDPTCVGTNVGDTDDDGGPTGDQGLRMTTSLLP